MDQFDQPLIDDMAVRLAITLELIPAPDDGRAILVLPEAPALETSKGLTLRALLSETDGSADDLFQGPASTGSIVLPSLDDDLPDPEHIPHDDDDPIIVDGDRPGLPGGEPPPNPSEPDDTGGLGYSDFKGVGWRDGPYEQCQNTSEMTPEELEDYLVAVEAAEIASDIRSKADRDNIEYGAIIYRDAGGVITHTPLTPGNATSVPNMSLEGMPNWGSALAVIHSHPANLHDPSMAGFRLIPTPYQDWAAFNTTQALIADSLETQHGYSASDAIARSNEFVYFVYGAFGPSGTDRYSLNRFDDSDEARQATATDNQLDNAERVNTDLGTCGF